MFNVRNKECQKQFSLFTSKDDRFSKCFESDEEDIDIQFSRWKRLLDKAIHACFKKFKVKEDTKR